MHVIMMRLHVITIMSRDFLAFLLLKCSSIHCLYDIYVLNEQNKG